MYSKNVCVVECVSILVHHASIDFCTKCPYLYGMCMLVLALVVGWLYVQFRKECTAYNIVSSVECVYKLYQIRQCLLCGEY